MLLPAACLARLRIAGEQRTEARSSCRRWRMRTRTREGEHRARVKGAGGRGPSSEDYRRDAEAEGMSLAAMRKRNLRSAKAEFEDLEEKCRYPEVMAERAEAVKAREAAIDGRCGSRQKRSARPTQKSGFSPDRGPSGATEPDEQSGEVQ